MRHRRLGHGELCRNVTHVHFTIKQNGNDAQAGWVAEGAEQVSQMSGGWFLEEHNKYMNNCSSIQYYKIKKENRQMTILLLVTYLLWLNSETLHQVLKVFIALIDHFRVGGRICHRRIFISKEPNINSNLVFFIVLIGTEIHHRKLRHA